MKIEWEYEDKFEMESSVVKTVREWENSREIESEEKVKMENWKGEGTGLLD